MDALFGGSFDPVHMGHLIVAEAVADALGEAVRIRFLPAREQPFKGAVHVATPEQRAEMLALAVMGNPRCTVERIELELPVPSYTVRTLRALRERDGAQGGRRGGPGGNRFTLLLGADAAQDLPQWYEVESLPRLAEVVVFARPGASIPSHPLITRVIEVPTVEVSATAIRARVAAGRSIRYWVPDAVREYIAAHGLYR